MYTHDYTNPEDIIYDLAKLFCVGDNLNYSNNWKLIFPKIDGLTNYPDFWHSVTPQPSWDADYTSLKGHIEDSGFKQTLIDSPRIVLKAMPRITKEWVNKIKITCIDSGTEKNLFTHADDPLIPQNTVGVKLPTNPDAAASGNPYKLAKSGQIRLAVEGKKNNFYRTNDVTKVQVTEFYMADGTSTIILPPSVTNGTVLIVDMEIDLSYTTKILGNDGYYLEFERPKYVSTGSTDKNYYYIQWRHGDTYDEDAEAPDTGWQGFPFIDNKPRWSWYKYPAASIDPTLDWGWLPIEYYLTIDQSSAVGILMGDVGISVDDYMSSPAYFGSLNQIDGALKTDTRGNFAGFSGNNEQPTLTKRYGDYTGTGVTDVLMISTKSGRPYQGHKLGLFGLYEFKEQTFNGLSAHTNKYSMTEIVIADVNENERGILKNCLAGPRVGKEHGVELVDQRYDAEDEQSYIYLHTSSFYTPFNTSNDVLIGFAIRIDTN